MMSSALELSAVTKKFKSFSLQEITFHLESGAIMGLVGQNGAGKTTMISCIMNLYALNYGSIQVFGKDHIEDEVAVKNMIGYVGDQDYFYYGSNFDRYVKAFSKVYDEWDDDLVSKLVKQWNIPIHQRLNEFSQGMKTKAKVILALAHRPKLLLLDEPTAGLDPVIRIELLDLLREFVADGEHSVLFSSHITSDLDKIADYVTILVNGAIKETMSIDQLEDTYAILTGQKEKLGSITPRLIGVRQGHNNFEALVRRDEIGSGEGVQLRVPNLEELLAHFIWEENSFNHGGK